MIISFRIENELVDKYDQALRNKQFIEDKNIDRASDLLPALKAKMLKTIKEFGIK
jgi:hypothetical protein